MTNGKSVHSPVAPRDPLILGHRGASAIAPENTLAAFMCAMRDGADGIEFDVRLSRDHQPVVIHDANLKRTGLIDRSVGELTAKELGEVDVGHWFGARTQAGAQSFAGEKLPTLAQVFDLFNTNTGVLYLEMKCNAGERTALAAAVASGIEESGMANRVVVESFDLDAIAAVKRIDAGIRTAALFEPRLSRPISIVRRRRIIDVALYVGADEIALHHTLVSRRLTERARRKGLEIVVWTVDDPRWITRARELDIKALIANNPATMVKHRNSSVSNR
jgi:glycerophosphoryl diester phosphodiesterase